ncbi:hypothetical protein LINGRAHAP2_LOCUS3297 [Linum grandiflorum]
MASEAFLDSCYRMALRCMATANVAGDMMQKEGLVHDVAASDVNASASTTTSDSSVVQQESYESQKRVQALKRKQQQGTSQASLPKKKKSTIDPIEKELSDSTQTQIGNTLETKQDAFLQQQAVQHLLQQNSGSLQSQVCIPVLDNSSQQRGSGDMMQRRTFQTAAHLPGINLKQQQLQQEKQVKEYLQQLALRRAQPAPQLFNGDICYRRLMQYMYHLQHRPSVSYYLPHSVPGYNFLAMIYAIGGSSSLSTLLHVPRKGGACLHVIALDVMLLESPTRQLRMHGFAIYVVLHLEKASRRPMKCSLGLTKYSLRLGLQMNFYTSTFLKSVGSLLDQWSWNMEKQCTRRSTISSMLFVRVNYGSSSLEI